MASKPWYQFLVDFFNSIFKSKPNPKPKPPVEEVYIVGSDSNPPRKEFTLPVPCSLSFEFTNFAHDPAQGDGAEEHLAWAVDSRVDWAGGNPQPNKSVYACSAKDYKLKCNGLGEGRISVKLEPEKRYGFNLGIFKDRTVETIMLDGKTIGEKTVPMPVGFVMPPQVKAWVGWPTGRNGAKGAKLYNIKTTGGVV
jgi:hypothetical protein